MNRDVTETLAVDGTDLSLSTVDEAVIAIQRGNRTVVADDATAVAVLERLGLSRSGAIDQVRVSYGPMKNRTTATNTTVDEVDVQPARREHNSQFG